MALNEQSLSADMPAGRSSGAVKRMRSTCNDKYTYYLYHSTFQSCYPITTCWGMYGRLKNYIQKFDKPHLCDTKIAVQQLMQRIKAIVTLNKVLKRCADTQEPDKLRRIIKPYQVIEMYFKAVGTDLAQVCRFIVPSVITSSASGRETTF